MVNFKEILDKIASNQCGPILQLPYGGINDEQAEMLAKALQDNTSITALNLAGNNIGKRGGIALAEALKVNKTLTELVIYKNKLGPDGGKAFAEALKVNKTLTEIGIDNNNLGPDGGKALAEALKVNETLTGIGLSNNNLGPDGGKALAEALKVNETLTGIVLSKNNLGPDGGKALSDALKLNKTLTEISLGNNNLGPDAGKTLAEALKVNKTLKDIGLAGNNLGPDAGKALTEALKVNRTLKTIGLFVNNFGSAESDILKAADEATTRNEKMSPIQKDILSLFPDTPLPSSDEAASEIKEDQELKESKEYVEEFDVKSYQSILEKIEQLENEDFPEIYIQELKDEAMLALCSWDNYASSEDRIKNLKDIIIRCQSTEAIPRREKALSVLSHIYLTVAMSLFQKDEKKEAEEYYLLAYTAALHGTQDDITKDIQNNALSLHLGGIGLRTQQEILLDLSAKHPDKLKALKEGYHSHCKDLGLSPLSLDYIIQPKAVVFTKSAFSFSQRQKETSSLDEDEESQAQDKKPKV